MCVDPSPLAQDDRVVILGCASTVIVLPLL